MVAHRARTHSLTLSNTVGGEAADEIDRLVNMVIYHHKAGIGPSPFVLAGRWPF